MSTLETLEYVCSRKSKNPLRARLTQSQRSVALMALEVVLDEDRDLGVTARFLETILEHPDEDLLNKLKTLLGGYPLP